MVSADCAIVLISPAVGVPFSSADCVLRNGKLAGRGPGTRGWQYFNSEFQIRTVFRRILLHLGVFLLYSIGISIGAFLLPPAYGLTAALLVFWLVLRYYLLAGAAPVAAERVAVLRLRPLGGPVLGWTLAAAPVLLVFAWSLGELYLSLVPVPPRILNPFGPLVLDPGRLLVITMLAIVAAPVIEEMFFRGLIQHPLEHRWGVAPGILVTAVIFALVHIDTLPWVIPLHVFLGAMFGWAVYTTRSIWAGVILHAANNSAAVLGLGGDAPDIRPTVWEAGLDVEWWLALGMLTVSGAVGVWVARRLRRASAASWREAPGE
jgi:membrane protease YdiL (CAAX protease family)